VSTPQAGLTCMWPVWTLQWFYDRMDVLFWRTVYKVQAGSTNTLETGWELFISGLSDLKTGCAETKIDSQFAVDNSGLKSPGHRDVRKMCPGRSPRFPVHGDRIPEDHRYIEFWFIYILSLSVPPCDQCWRCSIINIALNSAIILRFCHLFAGK
jgi:hypothetical protein